MSTHLFREQGGESERRRSEWLSCVPELIAICFVCFVQGTRICVYIYIGVIPTLLQPSTEVERLGHVNKLGMLLVES